MNFCFFAAALHALFVFDTLDPDVGSAMVKNRSLLDQTFEEVARSLEMTYEPHMLDGKKLTYRQLLDAMTQVRVEQDDLFVFYFSGHGGRLDEKKDPWPYLYFSGDRSAIDTLLIDSFVESLNPRFYWRLVDCCNATAEDVDKLRAITWNKERVRDNLKRLFPSEVCSVIVSSASPGEVSWAYDRYGSCFTLSLLQDLFCKLSGTKNVTWEALLMDASARLRVKQTHYWEIK